MALGLFGLASALVGSYRDSLAPESVVAGVRLTGQPVGALSRERVDAVVRASTNASLDRVITLAAGNVEIPSSPRALGAKEMPEQVTDAVLAYGRSGVLWDDLQARADAVDGVVDLSIGHRVDPPAALHQLRSLAPEVERPSLPTRLDLERRQVVPPTPGTSLLAHDSISALAMGLAAGAERIELVVQDKPVPVDDRLAPLAESLDISTLLGAFSTPYALDPSQSDRTHNLEAGAHKVDGTVLMPGQVLSFNDVVGNRTEDAGYRYAPGIADGEMIDVIGGGICQISSSLHGAAFFAGLDIVEVRPHTRPSSYVDMGLDSTVVYPSLDLKLRNPYDFAVVLHMVVSQGQVRAEVLGAKRPYRVGFERDVEEVQPYRVIEREDPSLASGARVLTQRGLRGFRIVKRRRVVRDGEVVRTDTWKVDYPATTEIVQRGTNPNGTMPPPQHFPPVREPVPHLRVTQ